MEQIKIQVQSRKLEVTPVAEILEEAGGCSPINDLEELLKSNGITAVLGCGLAFDICVRHTVVDANNLGFLTGVIRDCSQGFSQENIKETCRVLDSENIAVVDVWKARSIIERHKVPVEWICRLMDLIDNGSL
ncbi:unnamed protein product [Nippostrongylus brasiliensis]|uniref:nicotinamidase n=1 Tax=Nippostrongylus brasiliensis TaxID=27835 RepID=A0A0N4YFW3_NIPBR|nr:unnamed protein product [Nippostrongylus brasiliensis]